MGFFWTVGIGILISNVIMAIIMITSGKWLINTIWALFCVCVSILWVSLFYISMADSQESALIWWRIAYLGVTNLPVLILHTTILMIENKSKMIRYILIISYSITAIFYLLNLYSIFIPEVTYIFDEIYYNTPYSVWFVLFFIFFNILFGVIFDLLARAYKDPLRFDKDLILYFVLWIGIGMIGYSALLFPVFGVDIYPYGSILIAIYPLIIGFAILNHRLFNAKYEFLQLMKVIMVGLLSLSGVYFILFILRYFFSYTYEIDFLEVLISSVFIWLFIWLFRNKMIGNIFLLESLRDLEKETKKFIERSSVFSHVDELIVSLEEYFWRGIRVKNIKIIQDERKNIYPHIYEYFHKNNYPLIRGSISKNPARLTPKQRSAIAEEAEMIGAILFPIENIKNKGVLFLALWRKESEKPFNAEEIEVIQTILPKIALALQILEFNKSLQNEVKIQTKVLAGKNKELENAYEKLKEIDHNKDSFLAIASHELRTPMTIIKGYADLFLKNTLWPLNESEKHYMKKIYDSTDSLINMVNNILDISKIEAGRMEILIWRVDIQNIIKQCVSDFEAMYEEKNIWLFLTDISSTHIISTDEEKFRLIMTNLLSNACKFTLPWGKINIEVSAKKGYLHIRVCDTGVGISPKQIEHIFEKFSESHNTEYTKKSIRGTGLWLNLSKQIIEMLWGTITVSSKEWSWSCFEFTLPI